MQPDDIIEVLTLQCMMVAANEKTNVTCQEKRLTRGPHHREVRAREDAGLKKKTSGITWWPRP